LENLFEDLKEYDTHTHTLCCIWTFALYVTTHVVTLLLWYIKGKPLSSCLNAIPMNCGFKSFRRVAKSQ